MDCFFVFFTEPSFIVHNVLLYQYIDWNLPVEANCLCILQNDMFSYHLLHHLTLLIICLFVSRSCSLPIPPFYNCFSLSLALCPSCSSPIPPPLLVPLFSFSIFSFSLFLSLSVFDQNAKGKFIFWFNNWLWRIFIISHKTIILLEYKHDIFTSKMNLLLTLSCIQMRVNDTTILSSSCHLVTPSMILPLPSNPNPPNVILCICTYM